MLSILSQALSLFPVIFVMVMVIIIMIDQLASGEIEDMIETVDRNKDGKISYSEFRVIIVIVIVMN